MRMPYQRLPKQGFQAKTAGRRPRGRITSTWKENVLKAVSERGATWRSALTSDNDHTKWCTLWQPLHPQ